MVKDISSWKAQDAIHDLAKCVRGSTQATNRMSPLPEGYQPDNMDVICARGNKARNHPGNERFRSIINSKLKQYSEAKTKLSKSVIVSEIIHDVRASSPSGGFIKEKGGKWFEVGDHIAREKIGQSFRDQLFHKYKSSTKAKRGWKKEQLEENSCSEAELIKIFSDNCGGGSSVAARDHQPESRSTSSSLDVPFDEANEDILLLEITQKKIKSCQSNGNPPSLTDLLAAGDPFAFDEK